MQIGSSFHNFADEFFRVVDYEELGEAADLREIREVFLDTTRFIQAPAALENLVENFLEFESQRYLDMKGEHDDPIKYYKPYMLENKIEVLNAFRDEGIRIDMVGIIDRVDLLYTGTIALIEYKSGNLNEKRVERELLFYTLLLEKANEYKGGSFPEVTHLVGYSPRENDLVVLPMKKKKKDTVQRRIIKMAQDVMDGIFPCKENIFCPSCAGAEPCLESTVDKQMLLELCSQAAYSEGELALILETRPSTVKGMLSDLYLDGKVQRAFKGNKTYWWCTDD